VGRGHIISIQTTSERGGAEYANVDLLNALIERGHDVALLTNSPQLAAGTNLRVRELDIGPKLGRRSAVRVILQAPRTLLRLARALRAERPVAAVLVHFKKEQLLCSLLPRRLTGEIVWVEWGPVPPPMRRAAPIEVPKSTDEITQPGVPTPVPGTMRIGGTTEPEQPRGAVRVIGDRPPDQVSQVGGIGHDVHMAVDQAGQDVGSAQVDAPRIAWRAQAGPGLADDPVGDQQVAFPVRGCLHVQEHAAGEERRVTHRWPSARPIRPPGDKCIG